MKETIREALTHHWALDNMAAEVLANRIDDSGQNSILESAYSELSDTAIAKRDINRQRIGDIFSGRSDEKFIAIGPCSLDIEIDYLPLFEYIEELQSEHPEVVLVLRANGAKPRTNVGWTGLWYSNDPEVRQRQFTIYREAFERGLPIITEITEGNQLGALGPMLSSVWVGARDVEPTGHRGKFSAYHLPVGVKNGTTGDLTIVKDAIQAIRSNSEINFDSGVDLGTIASNPRHTGIATGIVPVGEGNQNIAIFSRGYGLPETLSTEERNLVAFDYLSRTNALGKLLGSTVVIDGTHSVPPMFGIPKKSADRFIPVLEVIHNGMRDDSIRDADQIVGVMGEVGIVEGRTDPNFVLDDERKEILRNALRLTVQEL